LVDGRSIDQQSPNNRVGEKPTAQGQPDSALNCRSGIHELVGDQPCDSRAPGRAEFARHKSLANSYRQQHALDPSRLVVEGFTPGRR
jgi:hypothetical protein